MNTSQRKYLTDKITSKINSKISEMESEKRDVPNINAYMLHTILSDNFDIINKDAIKELLRQKALKGVSSSRPEHFLSEGNRWDSGIGRNKIIFSVEEFFILPEEYKEALEAAKQHNLQIEEQVRSLRLQAETLITRITLASDSTLQKMINEVDDMGDLSLIDMKIRLLN